MLQCFEEIAVLDSLTIQRLLTINRLQNRSQRLGPPGQPPTARPTGIGPTAARCVEPVFRLASRLQFDRPDTGRRAKRATASRPPPARPAHPPARSARRPVAARPQPISPARGSRARQTG